MQEILNVIFFCILFLLIYASVYQIVDRICKCCERCAYFKAAVSHGWEVRDPYKNEGEGQK